jgi:hypothetical protein
MSEPTNVPEQPSLNIAKSAAYREGYANSVQIRLSVWDMMLVFGTMSQTKAEEVDIENFQGVYLSPQQAKALYGLLGQNLAQYEANFGEISLERPQASSQPGPRFVTPKSPIH